MKKAAVFLIPLGLFLGVIVFLYQGLFSDPYVDFKIKVFLGYAIKGIFSPEKIEAERLYYEQRSKMRRAKFRAKFIDR